MSFDQRLLGILEKLTVSTEERQSYINDAKEIRDYMIRKMDAENKEFRIYFEETATFGSFLNDFEIEKPDEFDVHLQFKLPCEIRVCNGSCPKGSLNLYLCKSDKIKGYPDTPISSGSLLSRKKLQNWMRLIFESIFKHKELNLSMENGRVYRIEYAKHLRGYAIAHTLFAVDTDDQKRKITLDFFPSFEFGQATWFSDREYPDSVVAPCSWYAVPYPKSRATSFMICAPRLEHQLLGDKESENVKNSLRLIKAIRDNNEMPYLKSYLIKTVYLWENERHKRCGSHLWKQSLGDLLICMIECLLKDFRTGHILFYWNIEVNLLNRLDGMEIVDYKRKLKIILAKLKNCRKGITSFNEIIGIFGS